MCIYGGHMCICVPNMKFLCLILCQGEVCTDATDDTNGNDDAGRWRMMDNSWLYRALWLINQMSQKLNASQNSFTAYCISLFHKDSTLAPLLKKHQISSFSCNFRRKMGLRYIVFSTPHLENPRSTTISSLKLGTSFAGMQQDFVSMWQCPKNLWVTWQKKKQNKTSFERPLKFSTKIGRKMQVSLQKRLK